MIFLLCVCSFLGLLADAFQVNRLYRFEQDDDYGWWTGKDLTRKWS